MVLCEFKIKKRCAKTSSFLFLSHTLSSIVNDYLIEKPLYHYSVD